MTQAHDRGTKGGGTKGGGTNNGARPLVLECSHVNDSPLDAAPRVRREGLSHFSRIAAEVLFYSSSFNTRCRGRARTA